MTYAEYQPTFDPCLQGIKIDIYVSVVPLLIKTLCRSVDCTINILWLRRVCFV